MKILQIAPPWIEIPPKDYGGTEWVIYNLAKGLTELGHDVTVFAAKNSKVLGKLKYVFEKNLLSKKIDWKYVLPTLFHFHQATRQAYQYDVIHAHLSSSADMAILPFLSDLTEEGVPNILTVHGHSPFDKYSNSDPYYIKNYGSSITAVGISEFMHSKMPKEFWDGGFVHNSLDLSSYKFNPKGGKYFTWVGKIMPKKGTAEAIKIAKKLGEQLIFAGIVDPYKEESVKYFENEVKPLIDGNQIKYLGPGDLKLKNELLGGARGFINPIDWEEPFGMVLVESLACGTPVISYDKGAVSEIIKDCVNGFLVNNKSEMLKAVKQMGKIKRKDCRKSAEENFSPKAASLKYLEIYRKEIVKHQLENEGSLFPPAGKNIYDSEEYAPSIAHNISIFSSKKES